MKNIREEQEIEEFIEWLRHFYNVSPKQKTKIIKKVSKENKDFGNWLECVRDFDFNMQDALIEELRYAEWQDS